jgi:dipeptidyl-peptidase-4
MTTELLDFERPVAAIGGASAGAHDRVELSSLGERELEALVVGLGEKPFRGKQVFAWLHGKRVASTAAMTDVPAGLRARLGERAAVWRPVVDDSRQLQVFLQQLNRRQDTNRMFLGNPSTGAATEFLMDRDDAWVDSDHRPTWLKDGKRFLFWSQRDGWRHLHLAHAEDGKSRVVTKGDFDVTDLVRVDEPGKQVYFMASPGNPTQRHLYRVGLDGHHLQRVTPKDAGGSHAYVVSPDGRWAFHTFSSFLQPPVTELVSLPDHKTMRVLQDNQALKEKLAALDMPKARFVRVRAATNVEIDGWRIDPPRAEPGRKLPVLVHVYGEPAGSTVRDAWGGKNLLWHLMLAQQGYVRARFLRGGINSYAEEADPSVPLYLESDGDCLTCNEH